MKTTKKNSSALIAGSSYGETLLCRKSATYWERLTQYFAIIILTVFPLLMGFNGYLSITEGKYILFKIFAFLYIIAAALIVVGFFLDKKKWRARKTEGFQKWSLPQILITAFAVWGVICAIVSPYSGLWEGQSRYEGVLSMLLYTAVFVLVAFWGEYSELYLPALALMAVAQGVVGLMQLFGVNLIYPEGYDYSNTLFVGMVGNIDCMGGIVAVTVPALICGFVLIENRWRYVMLGGASLLFAVEIYIDVDSGKLGLLAALAVALPYLVTERRHLKNTLYAGAALVMTFGLCKLIPISFAGYYTSVKLACAAMAAAVVMAVVAFLLGRRNEPLKLSAKTIRLGMFGLEALTAVAALIYLYGYSGSSTLLMNARDVLHGHLADEAGTYRGFVWKDCLVLMKDAPVFGCGPGAFMTVFEPYNRPELGVVYDFAHNDFLQIGVCMGYVGLAIYVAFVVALAVRAFKYATRCPLVVIFASSAAGYLIHSFFGFSIAIVAPVFWVMAGLLEKLIRQIPKNAVSGGPLAQTPTKSK